MIWMSLEVKGNEMGQERINKRNQRGRPLGNKDIGN